MALLKAHGIPLTDSLSIDYTRTTSSPKEKEKEEEEDKEKDKDPEHARAQTKARGTKEEIIAYCISLSLPATDGEWLFDKWQGNGWKNGPHPILDWKSTVRAWKGAGHMASQKPTRNGMPDKTRTVPLRPEERPPIWEP